MRMSSLKHNQAFTLIEVLVVVGLFAVIATSLFSSFILGMRVWKRSSIDSYQAQKAVISLERLSQELRQAIIYSEIPFEGEDAEVNFVNVRNNKIYNISYYYSKSDRALYRYAPYLEVGEWFDGGFKDTRRDGRAVIKNIQNFSFGYYLLNKTDKGIEEVVFAPSWNATPTSMPKAIRLSLRLKGNETFQRILSLPAA